MLLILSNRVIRDLQVRVRARTAQQVISSTPLIYVFTIFLSYRVVSDLQSVLEQEAGHAEGAAWDGDERRAA